MENLIRTKRPIHKPLIPRREPSVKARPKAYSYSFFTDKKYMDDHLKKNSDAKRKTELSELKKVLQNIYQGNIDQIDLFHALNELNASSPNVDEKVITPLQQSYQMATNSKYLIDQFKGVGQGSMNVNQLAEALGINESSLSTFLVARQLGKADKPVGYNYADAVEIKRMWTNEKFCRDKE